MTQTTVENFINGIDSKAPKQDYTNNRNKVYHIDDILS